MLNTLGNVGWSRFRVGSTLWGPFLKHNSGGPNSPYFPPNSLPEIILHSARGEIHPLEKKLHSKQGKPETKDIEEALLVAILNSHDFCIPSLVVAGARRLDCALYLAIQLEHVKSIAILLLCKATITGDCAVIKSLLSEPPDVENAPWYMDKVHTILSQGVIKMSYPIAVSIIEKNYEATKELLLRTDLDMHRKQVDWSKLKLTLLHPSWMYSISPWVVTLKLINNHLRRLPMELFAATQLRRLDLSQNLLETVQANIFALPNLEYLSLAHNRLKEIPETSAWSQTLLSLDLAENFLTTLPQGIQNSSIEILNLSKNQFTSIPKCLCRIMTLTSLDLSSTQITSFPPEMQHLDHLVNLNVSNANIHDLPGGGGVLRGAMKGIFKARARSSKTSNYIKLVLICNSDRVKGAMLSRLKPHCVNTEPLPEFDQFQWSYRPIFTRKLFNTHKLHFNTWLLGSEYEYNSIYPCFFTTGALYVLVWDITKTADMREQIKVYVDNLVRYAPTSNLLIINILPEGYEPWIVSNSDSLARRLNGFFSKPSYSSLNYHGLMMVVAKQNVKEGQSDIKQQIYDIASTMTVNGQLKIARQYPETYFHLIPVLEKEQQMFHTREKPGVLEETAIWTMFDKALSSDLLHRMELPVVIDFLQESGFILHYEDPNERLDQYYFTQPTWLYRTLMRIIRHALQHPSHIEVTYNELCTLANVHWSRDVGAALIRLMTRFAVVLPTRHNSYAITCLFPRCIPPSAELFCGNLRRQFAPKSKGLPVDLWVRVICRILFNLSRITDMSEVKGEDVSMETAAGKAGEEEERVGTDDETDEKGVVTKKVPTLERCLSTPTTMINSTKAKAFLMRNSASLDPDIQPDDSPVATPEHRMTSPPTATSASTSTAPPTSVASPTSTAPPTSVASPTSTAPPITNLQISNSKIEESDDGLTPVDDNIPLLSRGTEFQTSGGKRDSKSELVSSTDGDATMVELRDLSGSGSDDKISTTPTDAATVDPPTPQQQSAEEEADGSRLALSPQKQSSSWKAKTIPQSSERRSNSGGATDSPPPPLTTREEPSPPSSPHSSPHSSPQQQLSKLHRIVSLPAGGRKREKRSGTSSTPATLERGLWVWDAGIIHNRKGIKFSIYPCQCDMSAVEEKGIEICADLSRNGRVVFARLCRVIQQLLQERYPEMFSVELLLHKHELTQLAICPVCLDSNERHPTSFLVEACVHALLEKKVHNCRYHPETIPLGHLVPDYLMVDFPSGLNLPPGSFNYNQSQPLHHGRFTSLYEGHLKDKTVAIKLYHQLDGKTITFPLYHIQQELEMLTTLEHPNVVKVFGYSLRPTCVLIEKAPMGNLYQKLMDTEQKISRSVRFHIACQVASALNYLHKMDVIYRTLKASSILLWSLDFSAEVNIKLANFERAHLKSPSGLLGKTQFASYPAPEMLRYSFREEYSEKVDTYSFGILLYELVTRWQPFGGIYNTDRIPASQRPKLSSVNTTGYTTLVRLMEECWQEDANLRPSASSLILTLSLPSFQCHIATQVLRDCTSVRDCCFVPSVRQVWVYGEYNKVSDYGDGEMVEGTQVFILNSDNLTIQGTLELRERASAVFTVDSKVWIGMTEACVHAYDTTTFRFTDRFKLSDSVTMIADNDSYIFVAQANGHLSCFPKLQQKESQVIDIEIGSKAIIAMITVNDILWVSCGNELVILYADDDDGVVVEKRWEACSSNEFIYRLVLSKDETLVWSTVRGSYIITSWDVHTGKKKCDANLQDELLWICCELNYDPTYLRMVSVECVGNTLWVGLTCGAIVILTATEQPQKITYFRAHRSSPKVIKAVPEEEESGREFPMVLTGGFGEVSTVASNGSEKNGVIMSWHSLRAEDFKLVTKRHSKYQRDEL